MRQATCDRATDLAMTPDAKYLAAGDEYGQIIVWPLPEGEPLGTFSSGHTPIQCLAFGASRRRAPGRESTPQWLLASGDAGGVVAIWDIRARRSINVCRGTPGDIKAVAFHPDGTMLASVGRVRPRIWDVATGRLLLELEARNFMTSVAFSPDGNRLTVGKLSHFEASPMIDVWELESGRGIQTFRGMAGPVEKAIFSPNGRLVAGQSHDYQVGIWDRESGRLIYLLDAPQGIAVDNTSLAFSPDGRRFAFSSWKEAKLWDLDTGRELRKWSLPPGLADLLTFRGPDHLLLFRLETKDSVVPPIGAFDPRKHPRVCRIRDLLSLTPEKTVKEIADFNWAVHHVEAAPDGSFFLAEGIGGPKGESRALNAYDALTGEKLWSIESKLKPEVNATFGLDPSGKVLAWRESSTNLVLMKMPTRELLSGIVPPSRLLNNEGRQWITVENDDSRQAAVIQLHDRGGKSPRLRIACDSNTQLSLVASFSRDGKYLAWGNPDGSVCVCDMVNVQSRLTDVGLGW